MRGATRSAVRFLFRAAQSTAGRTGEVGTAPVRAEEDVAVEVGGVDGAVIAVPELDVGLIGVDVAKRLEAGQAPGTMFRTGLVSPMIRTVMSSLAFRSAEVPPPVWLRWRSLFLTLS